MLFTLIEQVECQLIQHLAERVQLFICKDMVKDQGYMQQRFWGIHHFLSLPPLVSHIIEITL